MTTRHDLAAPLSGAVDVLVDDSGRLGPLSYLVPIELDIRAGDAVHVPFGKREAHGMVLGPSKDPSKANKEIIRRWGKRVSAAELAMADWVAERHFCDLSAVALRLSPRHSRGAPPLDAGEVALLSDTPLPAGYASIPAEATRRLYLCAPLVSMAALAARDAVRIAQEGQVLVLCPTKAQVTEVISHIGSGVARLDVSPKEGQPSAWKGFAEGSVRIGVGTRSSALWSPQSLAGIVVVAEDHPGHVEATQPHTNARDLAIERTEREGAQLSLLARYPSAPALGGNVKVCPIGSDSDWPKMVLFDRTTLAPGDRDLPAPILAGLRKRLADDKASVVVAESRPAVRRCTKCRAVRACTSCGSQACDHSESQPCERCFGDRVQLVGWDVPRVRRALEAQLGEGALTGDGVQVVTVAELADLPEVGSVVILDIDPALRSAGWVPEALVAHVVMSAAAVAGREGSVVAATSQPSSPALQNLFTDKDLVSMAKRSWTLAKELDLPPFGRMVTLRVTGKSAPDHSAWPGTVHGPKQVGSDWEYLLRCADEDWPRLARVVGQLRKGRKLRLTVS